MTDRRDRWIGSALLAPVLIAVAFSFTRLVLEGRDVPDDDDYAAAAAWLDERGLGDDDAVVVLPPWTLRPFLFLQQRTDRVVAGDGPWWPLVQGRFRRLFVIAEPDAGPWLSQVALPPATSPQQRGALTVSEHAVGGPALFDFKARLAEATVELTIRDPATAVDTTRLACADPVRGGVRCAGRPAWQRVAREWALVTENGSDVVVAHPPPRGETLTLRWSDVELGASLVVAAGHTRDGAQKARAPVTLQVRIDDVVVASVVRQPSFVVEPSRAGLRARFVAPLAAGGQGFRVDVVDTARFAGTRHQVSFVIRSDHEADNDFAFDAFVPGMVGASVSASGIPR